ncbi:MAG TPA: hypothetical protein VG101_07660 [Puia sp.]|jgi:hypothetical protein|nr:hypothetical protein [Puia sp.]
MKPTTMTRFTPIRSLSSVLLGMMLLLPGSYFMLTLTARVFGAKAPYYFIAPSFLQSPFNLFAFHKAQFIIGTVVLATIFNLWALRDRRHWLNAAVAIQGVLLLVTLFCYTLIQHIRYEN